MSYEDNGEYGDGVNGGMGDDVYMDGGAAGGYDDDEEYGDGVQHVREDEEHDEYDPSGGYGEDGGYKHMDEDEDEVDPLEEDISQEDAWVVISSYFSEKGLVRQQLDSFDEVRGVIGTAGAAVVDDGPRASSAGSLPPVPVEARMIESSRGGQPRRPRARAPHTDGVDPTPLCRGARDSPEPTAGSHPTPPLPRLPCTQRRCFERPHLSSSRAPCTSW